MSSPYPFPETTAPGYGIVREVRRFKLDAGLNHIDFSGAPRDRSDRFVPIAHRAKTTALLEQNLTLAKSGSSPSNLELEHQYRQVRRASGPVDVSNRWLEFAPRL